MSLVRREETKEKMSKKKALLTDLHDYRFPNCSKVRNLFERVMDYNLTIPQIRFFYQHWETFEKEIAAEPDPNFARIRSSALRSLNSTRPDTSATKELVLPLGHLEEARIWHILQGHNENPVMNRKIERYRKYNALTRRMAGFRKLNADSGRGRRLKKVESFRNQKAGGDLFLVAGSLGGLMRESDGADVGGLLKEKKARPKIAKTGIRLYDRRRSSTKRDSRPSSGTGSRSRSRSPTAGLLEPNHKRNQRGSESYGQQQQDEAQRGHTEGHSRVRFEGVDDGSAPRLNEDEVGVEVLTLDNTRLAGPSVSKYSLGLNVGWGGFSLDELSHRSNQAADQLYRSRTHQLAIAAAEAAREEVSDQIDRPDSGSPVEEIFMADDGVQQVSEPPEDRVVSIDQLVQENGTEWNQFPSENMFAKIASTGIAVTRAARRFRMIKYAKNLIANVPTK